MKKSNASEITKEYRTLINELKVFFEEHGFKTVESDSDSVFIIGDSKKLQALDLKAFYPRVVMQFAKKSKEDENVKALLEWTPSCFELPKDSDMYEEGDEKAPFFSEAYLYNLLGKEDARTLVSLLKKALGVKSLP